MCPRVSYVCLCVYVCVFVCVRVHNCKLSQVVVHDGVESVGNGDDNAVGKL